MEKCYANLTFKLLSCIIRVSLKEGYMKTEESLSRGIIKRIVFIAVIVMLLMGVGVFASVTNTNTVTIVFSDNTELSIITSKTKVSEILKENNIVLMNDEIVNPGFDSEVDASKTIKIPLQTKYSVL